MLAFGESSFPHAYWDIAVAVLSIGVLWLAGFVLLRRQHKSEEDEGAAKHRIWAQTALERLMFELETETDKMTILCALQLVDDQRITMKEWRDVLEEWTSIYAKFKCRLHLAESGPSKRGMYWEHCPDFDIGHHLHEESYDGTFDEKGVDAHVLSKMSQLMEMPWDFTKPLWSSHVLHGSKHDYLIVRLHHTLGDGLSLMHTAASMGKASISVSLKPSQDNNHRSSHSMQRISTSAIIGGADFVTKMVQLSLYQRRVFAKASDEPQVKKEIYLSPVLTLDDVKLIARSFGTTVNDVLVTILAGVIRELLITRQDLLDPELWSTIPVSLRESHDAELGMKIGFVYLKLPVWLDDPIKRLQEVKKRIDLLKVSPEMHLNRLAQELLVKIAPKSVWRWLSNAYHHKFTATISNVPGPREPMHLYGKAIDRMFCAIPTAGCRLAFSIVSYSGQISVSLTTHPGFLDSEEVNATRRKQCTSDRQNRFFHAYEREFSRLLKLARSHTQTDRS